MGWLVSLLVLSFLIFFHELGHFLAARFFGVHVERFSIGFGKIVLSRTVGKTQYVLSAIPLGGYVKMKGQDDADPLSQNSDDDSYNTKRPWQRIVILLAGPFANFLLAFLLYAAIGLIGVQDYKPLIGSVSENSPAQAAGLAKGDRIVAINAKSVESWSALSRLISQSHGGLELAVERRNKIRIVSIFPTELETKNLFGESVKRRMIGIAPSGERTVVHHNVVGALVYGWRQSVEAGTVILVGIQKLFEGVVPAKEVGGVISIVQVTAEASQYGIVALFALTALISVNLGILNLFPIPALDGGHIMFTLYEMVTGKLPSETVLYRMTLAGWAVLIWLMFFGLYNDLNRLAG